MNRSHSKKTGEKVSGRKKNASAVRRADPFYARECERYEAPLPSREYVVQMLAEQGRPMGIGQLARLLDIQEHEAPFFERRLRAMERDGDLVRNRRDAYIIPDKVALIRGKVEGHPDGFGFLIPDDGSADVFLGPRQMREVLHGDRAMVRISGVDRRGRPEGQVVEVLERAAERLRPGMQRNGPEIRMLAA